MSEKFKKILNNKYFIIVLIVLLIALVIGTGTYAWLSWSSPSTTKLTVKIGNIADVIFDKGKDINTTSLAPVFTSDQGEKTNFSIVKRSSAGTSEITYEVTLNITSIATELKDSSFKYILMDKNTNAILTSGDFSTATNNSTISLYSGNLNDSRKDFEFIIYIDSNTENNSNMMNKTFKASLNVSAKKVPTAADTISDLYDNSTKTSVTNNGITYQYDTTHSLMKDVGGNIRYYGASPNNYIYFNCSDYTNQSSSTCETWRIIGVFDGKLKIMRNESIGNYSWDNKDTTTGAEAAYGKNDWTTARLMKLLNPSNYYTIDSNDNGNGQSLYYNAKSGTCFSGQNNVTTSCNFTSTGIKNDTTRNMIAEVTWNIGGSGTTSLYANQTYENERGKTVYSGRPTTWTGQVALPYISDYGYAADLSKCKVNLENYNDTTCTSNNWMKSILGISSYGWLLTPNSGYSYSVWCASPSGYVHSASNACNPIGVVPTLYFQAKFYSGDGTSTNPYKLNVQ